MSDQRADTDAIPPCEFTCTGRHVMVRMPEEWRPWKRRMVECWLCYRRWNHRLLPALIDGFEAFQATEGGPVTTNVDGDEVVR